MRRVPQGARRPKGERMRRTVFPHKLLPWLLLAPQLAITLIFFYWPAAQAFRQSMLREDAFGLKTTSRAKEVKRASM